MTHYEAYDVEIFPNLFSITIVNVGSYMKIFADCRDKDDKPIPLVQKLAVAKIKERLDKVACKQFVITDTDDSQLYPMIDYLMQYANNNEVAYYYGYNNLSYDKLMIGALLMYFNQTDDTKELITKLYETSKKIIELQDNKDASRNDFTLRTLRNYILPFIDVDVMRIFALNKAGTIIDKNGEKKYVPKALKQTSINLQWYELLEYDMPPISQADASYYTNQTRYANYTIDQLNQTIDKWDRYVIEDYIADELHYNKNDVFIVCEIIRLNPDEIKSRYAVSASYKVDVLNSSRSNMADVLFQKFYTKFSGIPYERWKDGRTERKAMSLGKIIFDCIKFKTKPLQDLLDEVKHTVLYRVSKDAFEKHITIGNTVYTMATGGLHSQDKPMEIWSTSQWSIDATFTGSLEQSDNEFTIYHFDISDAVS